MTAENAKAWQRELDAMPTAKFSRAGPPIPSPANRLTCDQCGVTFTGDKPLGLALTYLAHSCAVARIRETVALADQVYGLLHPEMEVEGAEQVMVDGK